MARNGRGILSRVRRKLKSDRLKPMSDRHIVSFKDDEKSGFGETEILQARPDFPGKVLRGLGSSRGEFFPAAEKSFLRGGDVGVQRIPALGARPEGGKLLRGLGVESQRRRPRWDRICA